MKKKVINKGYTITVTSWENDGDNYNTKSITVDSEEKAKVYYEMMQLCKSENNQPKGVIKLGNVIGGFSKKQKELMHNFLRNNPILLEGDDVTNASDEQLEHWFIEIASELLGSSEDFDCRVMESCDITYSPEDVFSQQIKF